MENNQKLPTNCPHCGELVNYLNNKHHLYMYCNKEKPKNLLDGIEKFKEKHGAIFGNKSYEELKDKTTKKNTWYNFKEKQPPKDAEILVYGNKLEKYAVEYVDSEFETRKINLNYFQWMLLRKN